MIRPLDRLQCVTHCRIFEDMNNFVSIITILGCILASGLCEERIFAASKCNQEYLKILAAR
jgi:hypothetical protein